MDEIILTRCPDLKSIRDFGPLPQCPWLKSLFNRLGEQCALDRLEREQWRPCSDNPRLRAAVNCASIGCPACRIEALGTARLDAQLEDGMQGFPSDRTRILAKASKL